MSKRFLYTSVAAVAAAAIWLGTSTPTVEAYPWLKEAFVKEYVKADSTDAKDVAFKAAADKASCAICHEGKTKKVRNAFGKAVGQNITKADKGNDDKIKEALAKASKEHSIKGDDTSPTFGEKIADGKLPASK